MVEFKNKFSWSFSRDSLFRECKRKYFYNYYGSWEGWKKDSADNTTRTLYVLKNLINRKIWKGDAVHKEISRTLKSYESTGRFSNYENSVKRTTNIMRQEFRFSKNKSYWDTDRSLRKVNALFEHEYDLEITDDEWIENYNDVLKCLDNFYKSDITSELKDLDTQQIMTIDSITPTPFDFNNETIYVNLDLAYKIDTKVKIVDWKTGSGESNPLQFVVYTFHANDFLKIPLEDITVIEYNLLNDKKIIYSYSAQDISEAKQYIENSINEMKSYLYDADNNSAEITDFPRTDENWRCENCNFKKICFELP